MQKQFIPKEFFSPVNTFIHQLFHIIFLLSYQKYDFLPNKHVKNHQNNLFIPFRISCRRHRPVPGRCRRLYLIPGPGVPRRSPRPDALLAMPSGLPAPR